MTLSKEAVAYMDAHPDGGAFADMPQELKAYFHNSVEVFNALAADHIIDSLPPAQRNIVRTYLAQKDASMSAMQKDNRDMSEVFEKMLDYGRRGRIHKVG